MISRSMSNLSPCKQKAPTLRLREALGRRKTMSRYPARAASAGLSQSPFPPTDAVRNDAPKRFHQETPEGRCDAMTWGPEDQGQGDRSTPALPSPNSFRQVNIYFPVSLSLYSQQPWLESLHLGKRTRFGQVPSCRQAPHPIDNRPQLYRDSVKPKEDMSP